MTSVTERRLLPVRYVVTLRGGRGWTPPVPLGNGACGMCGTVLEGRRRSWCSSWCEDLAAICSTSAAARVYLWSRDRGVCAHCPPDTPPWPRHTLDPGGVNGWEVDHIVALIDGGAYTPDNLQTLCVVHHRLKSAGEARCRRR